MPERPELPTSFRHHDGVYNLLPDDKPMTWSVWALDGCIGDIVLTDTSWTAQASAGTNVLGPFPSWADATVALVRAAPLQGF